MEFLARAVHEPPLQVDLYAKACRYNNKFFGCDPVLVARVGLPGGQPEGLGEQLLKGG